MDWRLSDRMRAVGRSDVAQILKLAEEPDVISFAGGLPDPATFLVDELRVVTAEVLRDRTALGYSPTPGIGPLRAWLAARMAARGRPTDPSEIVVTTGGIAALDLIAKVLVNPGDVVIVGEPAYLAALHVFRSYRARLCGVAVDGEGMVPEALAEVLAQLARDGVHPALIYVVPSFQNPSGATMPAARREQLLSLAARSRVPVVEDAAYRDLRFEGEAPPLCAALDPDLVIHINTFSKVLNPGVRLGWIAAPRAFIDAVVMAKQGQDQCSSALSQHLCLAMAERGLIARQTELAIGRYAGKRDAMLDALAAHMPDGVTWTRPEGGFYTWVTLHEDAHAEELLTRAVAEEGVAYVPGPAFFHDGSGQRFMRLCYSYVAADQIDEGVRRLAGLVRAPGGAGERAASDAT